MTRKTKLGKLKNDLTRVLTRGPMLVLFYEDVTAFDLRHKLEILWHRDFNVQPFEPVYRKGFEFFFRLPFRRSVLINHHVSGIDSSLWTGRTMNFCCFRWPISIRLRNYTS